MFFLLSTWSHSHVNWTSLDTTGWCLKSLIPACMWDTLNMPKSPYIYIYTEMAKRVDVFVIKKKTDKNTHTQHKDVLNCPVSVSKQKSLCITAKQHMRQSLITPLIKLFACTLLSILIQPNSPISCCCWHNFFVSCCEQVQNSDTVL